MFYFVITLFAILFSIFVYAASLIEIMGTINFIDGILSPLRGERVKTRGKVNAVAIFLDKNKLGHSIPYKIACMPSKDSGPEVIKLFSCSTQLSMKFSLLISMKMPTIVGIFIFISRENFMLSYV